MVKETVFAFWEGSMSDYIKLCFVSHMIGIGK